METQSNGTKSDIIYLTDTETIELINGLSKMLLERSNGMIGPTFRKSTIHIDNNNVASPSVLRFAMIKD